MRTCLLFCLLLVVEVKCADDDPFIKSISIQPLKRIKSWRKSAARSGFGEHVSVRIVPSKQPKWARKMFPLSAIRANSRELKLSLKYLASINRYDKYSKIQARQYIWNSFESFNLKSVKQEFQMPPAGDFGTNVIGIRPGVARKKRSTDRLVLIGAHYDTVMNTSGLNDNGSGVAVMLEVIRLLDYYQCETNFTILFVAFDMEESGAIGSKYFVHEYLIPNELSNGESSSGSGFQGAIILDTVMNYDSQRDTQDIPNDIHQGVPDFTDSVKRNGYRGDFLAMFARTKADHRLVKLLTEAWNDHDKLNRKSRTSDYRFKPVTIDSLSVNKVASYENLKQHVNMLRSDHLHFWYHNHTNHDNSLSAVLLTDTGYMRYCYHKPCDDSRFLNTKNVGFLKKTTDVLIQTVLRMTEGRCFSGETTLNRQPRVTATTTNIVESSSKTRLDCDPLHRIRLLLELALNRMSSNQPLMDSYSCTILTTLSSWIDLFWIVFMVVYR